MSSVGDAGWLLFSKWDEQMSGSRCFNCSMSVVDSAVVPQELSWCINHSYIIGIIDQEFIFCGFYRELLKFIENCNYKGYILIYLFKNSFNSSGCWSPHHNYHDIAEQYCWEQFQHSLMENRKTQSQSISCLKLQDMTFSMSQKWPKTLHRDSFFKCWNIILSDVMLWVSSFFLFFHRN